ncbi:MAG: hypothetical protein M3096_00545 [Actinomycetia bacterium]|nr:hypothetical protein [Actinomycetes bacterium]
MNDNVMRGRRLDGGSRPPKTYSTERLCASSGCDTKLSRYNRREFCFAHAPIKYPRLRGRIVSSEA